MSDADASVLVAPAVSSLPVPLAFSQVDHVVKDALPSGVHATKDAKIVLHKAANIFVVYMEALITDARVGRLHTKKGVPKLPKRVLITPADVRSALEDAGMGHLVPQLSSSKRPR